MNKNAGRRGGNKLETPHHKPAEKEREGKIKKTRRQHTILKINQREGKASREVFDDQNWGLKVNRHQIDKGVEKNACVKDIRGLMMRGSEE